MLHLPHLSSHITAPQPKVTPNIVTATLKYQKQNNKEMLLKKGLRNAPFSSIQSIHPANQPARHSIPKSDLVGKG